MTGGRLTGLLRARAARIARVMRSARPVRPVVLRQPARRVGWGRSERGESLIELIISITIMSIAVVTIVGAIATSIMMSDIHRKQTTAGSYIRSYAQAIQDTVASDISGAAYASICSSAPAPAGLDTGSYTASVSSCTPSGNLTTMVLQVASKDTRDTEQLQIVVRRPCVAPTVDGQTLDSGCNS